MHVQAGMSVSQGLSGGIFPSRFLFAFCPPVLSFPLAVVLSLHATCFMFPLYTLCMPEARGALPMSMLTFVESSA
jgi:hypothetical protein